MHISNYFMHIFFFLVLVSFTLLLYFWYRYESTTYDITVWFRLPPLNRWPIHPVLFSGSFTEPVFKTLAKRTQKTVGYNYPRNSETPPIPASLKGTGPSLSISCFKQDERFFINLHFCIGYNKHNRGGENGRHKLCRETKKLKHRLRAFIPLLQQPPDPLESRKGFCNQHYTVAHMPLEICLMNIV